MSQPSPCQRCHVRSFRSPASLGRHWCGLCQERLTITIISNYKGQVQAYADAIRELNDLYDRVSAVVNNAVQGEKPDFVFHGRVSSKTMTAFNGDGSRLMVTDGLEHLR